MNLLLITDFFTGSLIAAPQGVNNPIPSDETILSPNVFGGDGGTTDTLGDNFNFSDLVINSDDNSSEEEDDGNDPIFESM